MKAVLISIQPRWCKLIANGKKTIEVRKTKPKLETPFKVYIYCTKGDPVFTQSAFCDEVSNGKVIGEFVCDDICKYEAYKWRQGGFEGLNYKYDSALSGNSCVSQDELVKYGRRKTLYGWHISDLVIYDKPKELREFRSYNVKTYIDEHGYPMPTHTIKRPPQSWCYVEEGE